MTGEEFKKHRKDLKLSRGALAFDLCVSIETINSWESGRRNIHPGFEKLFCTLYNLSFKAPSKFKYEDETPYLFPDEE